MPKLAKQYSDRQYYYDELYKLNDFQTGRYVHQIPPQRYVRPERPIRRKVKQENPLARFFAILITVMIGIFILPISFEKVTKSFFIKTPYQNVKADYYQLLYPTTNYLSNDWFLGTRALRGAEIKKPLMNSLNETTRMGGLENQIKNLMSMYPSIKPSVYVWDYDTERFADINADEIYAAASIIKLPVLVQLFRSIERNQLTIYDEMTLTDYYRAEGSGGLQFKAENSKYSIDTLARIMITDSDNSATNMLMSKIGSMTDVNQGIREWGLKNTQVQTWLPDLGGTNHTTGRDLATILYNIDNPNFLDVTSREKIFDYMGHVKNNRLIQAGLGSGAVFLHKTGDIGKMLGDAGIVFAPNGKKYIVVILANRPHNSIAGKEFIVKASEIIYNHMVR